MKRSIFGVYQSIEIVGALVRPASGVVIAVLINAGLLKELVPPPSHPALLLPDEGVSGLGAGRGGAGAGTRGGRSASHRDRPQPAHASAIALVEDPDGPFIRRDSVRDPRRQFGLRARPSSATISRGSGPWLYWSYAVNRGPHTTERARPITNRQILDEVRARSSP